MMIPEMKHLDSNYNYSILWILNKSSFDSNIALIVRFWNEGRRLLAWSVYKDTGCAASETISSYVSTNVILHFFYDL